MSELEKKHLVAAFLKHGKSAEPFKIKAFAQILLKVMYQARDPISLEGYANNMARLLGTSKVSLELVKPAMDYLESEDIVVLAKSKWHLNQNGKDIAKRNVVRFKENVDHVLKKHFPDSIDRAKLEDWFLTTCVKVFSQIGEEWVAFVSDKQVVEVPRESVRDIVSQVVEKHNMKRNSEDLMEGFLSFVSSEATTDRELLFDLSSSFFASRLVAAGVGIDLIGLEKITGATFILDTNVIIDWILESTSGGYFSDLGNAMKLLKAKIVYLHITEEEYGGVLRGAQKELIRRFSKWQIEVLSSVDDSFVRRAIALNVRTEDDIGKFFLSISDISKRLSTQVKLSKLDDDKVAEVVKKAVRDNELKDKIKQYSSNSSYGGKRDVACEHDSALIYIVDSIRAGGNSCWALSLDRSLYNCDVDEVGNKSTSRIMPLEVLVQLLALNDVDPAHDASEYAPLMQKMLVKRFFPDKDTFSLRDLDLIAKLDSEASTYPYEKVQGIFNFIAKAKNRGVDFANPDFQIEIQRKFFDVRKDIDGEIRKHKGRAAISARETKKTLDLLVEKDELLVEVVSNQLIRDAKWKFAWKVSFRMILSLLLAYFIWLLMSLTDFDRIVGDLLSLILFALTVLKWTVKPYDDLCKFIAEGAKIQAKQKYRIS